MGEVRKGMFAEELLDPFSLESLVIKLYAIIPNVNFW